MIGIDTGFLVALELVEHPAHDRARALLETKLGEGHVFACCPQVLSEFLHVVTDPRRFERPLGIEVALARGEAIWNARETRRVFPCEDSFTLFANWMTRYRLGRKRILDTQLAATYYARNVRELASTDFRDFAVFEVFTVHRL